MTILPTQPGERARVEWRPHSAAFDVVNNVITVAKGDRTDISLTQTSPREGIVSAQIAEGFVPPLRVVKKLVQTFRIDDPAAPQDPADFARTTFIEALRRAGVAVNAPLVAPNPSDSLPPPESYRANAKVAELVSAPYAQYSKLILKLSHNLGANLSLMLFGLANGVNTIQDALCVEASTLVDQYELRRNGFDFPTNGSGSPDSRAAAAVSSDQSIPVDSRAGRAEPIRQSCRRSLQPVIPLLFGKAAHLANEHSGQAAAITVYQEFLATECTASGPLAGCLRAKRQWFARNDGTGHGVTEQIARRDLPP